MTCSWSKAGLTGLGINSTGINHCRQYMAKTLVLNSDWKNFGLVGYQRLTHRISLHLMQHFVAFLTSYS